MDHLLSGLICSAMILVVSLVLKAAFHGRGRSLNLPPGPKPWPIIGNLNLIGPLPHISMHQLSMQYGPIMQLYFGSVPIVVGSSVDMARKFLKTHDLNFASRPKSASGKYTAYDHSDVTWSPYGPYVRQARKLFITELFSPKQLDLYEYIRVDELHALLSDVYAANGEPITLKRYISNYNLNNICRMVLGKQYLGSKPGILSPVEFKKIIDEWFLLNGVLNIGDFIPWINFLDLQGYVKRMKVVGRKLDCFLEYVIDDHIAARQQNEGQLTEDMVDVLLKLAKDPNLNVKLERNNVKALIQDLLAGGTDTSTLIVEWAMSELMKRPETLETATRELDRVIGRDKWVEEKDIPLLPYIEAITKETMRMHPIAPNLAPHFSCEDCKIDGYDILAGTQILVNVWSIGRDPTLWDAPNEFRPERFIGSDIDVKGHHFELLPFGTGRRMCTGYNLGLKLIQTSLSNLIHGFSWNLPDHMQPEDLNMEEVYGLTVPKKVQLVVVAKPRLPTHLYSC